MKVLVNLYSSKSGEIRRFLTSYYSNDDFSLPNEFKWEHSYENPIEISDIIGTFIDNEDQFDINMWICLDENILINVTPSNSDKIIRYLFERYPY